MSVPQYSPDQRPERGDNLANPRNFDSLVLGNKGYFSMMLYKFAETSYNILSTSKGRNTICSLIQYQAKLIYSCNINSNIPEVAEIIMYYVLIKAPVQAEEDSAQWSNLLYHVQTQENIQPLQIRRRSDIHIQNTER